MHVLTQLPGFYYFKSIQFLLTIKKENGFYQFRAYCRNLVIKSGFLLKLIIFLEIRVFFSFTRGVYGINFYAC